MNRDELQEKAWQAWLANGTTAKAGVVDAVDAVEPIIRANERERKMAAADIAFLDAVQARQALADLRAKVEAKPHGLDKYGASCAAVYVVGGECNCWKSDVLALLEEKP